MTDRPDIVVLMTDQERAAPSYEADELRTWRRSACPGAAWFDDHGVSFDRHYTGSLACVPSRPTLFTGQYPDVHGVTQTDGLGKMADDSRMRWMRGGEVPTLGNWFRAAGYDTHYDGKWHITHADLVDPESGAPLATNDASGRVDHDAVRAYLEADPLAPYGFSGWVGPEPHGGQFANSGLVRDPLIAERVVAWLRDRYERRRAGDSAAQRPFLLIASFVNPHDIVFFPLWMRRGLPNALEAIDVPTVAPSPTDDEDLSTKPSAQAAYRASYPSLYGPAAAVEQLYRDHASDYRELYLRLHAAVDAPLDRVRSVVVDEGGDTVLVRTADHGELLGSHGGLHQKWFQLYDEATRVPCSIARTGDRTTAARRIAEPTSHVDLVPTLLSAASVDVNPTSDRLRERFSEVHTLPGRDLMPVVDGADPDRERVVYLMTRDNIAEGDSGAGAVARHLGIVDDPPAQLRIHVPAHVGANFEGIVVRVDERDVVGGAGHVWKLTRCFDDPATWTDPGVRHLAASGQGGFAHRTEALPDQWELYDLDADPIEAHNRWDDPEAAAVFRVLLEQLTTSRTSLVPVRNSPWPYARRGASAGVRRSPRRGERLRRTAVVVGAQARATSGRVATRVTERFPRSS